MGKDAGALREAWETLARTEWAKVGQKGEEKNPFGWDTPEGIEVKPLYTASDLEELSHLHTFPGFLPYARGIRATMYTGRPWTLRQYAGFSTARETNAFFFGNAWPEGNGDFPLHLTCPPIEDMTQTIPGLWEMLERLVLQLIPLRI